jgi:hypothetical protein
LVFDLIIFVLINLYSASVAFAAVDSSTNIDAVVAFVVIVVDMNLNYWIYWEKKTFERFKAN